MVSISPLTQKVIDALRCVHDPEIPSISVLDLGLIYELEVTVDGDVYIQHTLTSMMCPFADQICKDIEEANRIFATISYILIFNISYEYDFLGITFTLLFYIS